MLSLNSNEIVNTDFAKTPMKEEETSVERSDWPKL